MTKLLAAAVLVTMTACAATAGEVPVRGGGGKCDSAKAQKLAGRARSAKVGAEALRLSGATALRWIPSGGMVTMDYRENRINLRLNTRNKIVRVTCG